MRRVATLLAVIPTLFGATSASEGPVQAGDASAMKALEAGVPPQSWYPADYYDYRIAAEAFVAETPRATTAVVSTQGGRLFYSIPACDAGDFAASASETTDGSRQAGIALEVSRMRSELAGLNFPADAYAAPLLAFERDMLTEKPVANAAPSVGFLDTMRPLPSYAALAAAIEANRSRLAPDLPTVIAAPPCRRFSTGMTMSHGTRGIARGPALLVTLATEPPSAEVLLINAFAFKVCARKQLDPWDRFKCRWSEVETGVGKPLSGRYVYQVHWPDGSVRKGTRDIAPAANRADAKVTFRKTGSQAPGPS